jgi:hypothetical protein
MPVVPIGECNQEADIGDAFHEAESEREPGTCVACRFPAR